MVMPIYLTKDKFALVDNEDYPELIKHRWFFNTQPHRNGGGYAYRTIELPKVDGERKKTSVAMHRAIMKDIPKGYVVDHIDGNGLNNQKNNLRVITQAENMKNKRYK